MLRPDALVRVLIKKSCEVEEGVALRVVDEGYDGGEGTCNQIPPSSRGVVRREPYGQVDSGVESGSEINRKPSTLCLRGK